MTRHYRTPEECALEGFTPAAEARVVAEHQIGDYAGMYVVTTDRTGQGDTVAGAYRDDLGWTAMNSGSAAWAWSSFPGDPALEEGARMTPHSSGC